VAKKGAETKLKQGDPELENLEQESVSLAARIEAAQKRNASKVQELLQTHNNYPVPVRAVIL
jgi:hypothetical protein